jgi:hypothetical protein
MTNASALYASERARIVEAKVSIARRYVIGCVHCHGQSVLRRWFFVQKFWYTPPSGCIGGDYWNKTETAQCDIACPLCRVCNYLYTHPKRDQILERIDGALHKEDLFSEVWEKHGNRQMEKVFPKACLG